MLAPHSTLDAPIKILLIEDNDISRQLFSDFLLDCGFDILSLAEGKSFTSSVKNFKPDLILLDIKLPDIDGYELLRILQTTPEWTQIPVIVISAFAFQSDQRRAISLGARRYLVKPVRLIELTEAIQAETSKGSSNYWLKPPLGVSLPSDELS